MTNESILAALSELDIENDDHWTTEGLPRLDIVSEILGNPVARSVLNDAAKGFNRKNPHFADESFGFAVGDDTVLNDSAVFNDSADVKYSDENKNSIDDAKVEKELQAARQDLAKAQKRHNDACKAMDAVIRRREEENERNPADDIKRFQESQMQQRAETARIRVAVASASAGLKNQRF